MFAATVLAWKHPVVAKVQRGLLVLSGVQIRTAFVGILLIYSVIGIHFYIDPAVVPPRARMLRPQPSVPGRCSTGWSGAAGSAAAGGLKAGGLAAAPGNLGQCMMACLHCCLPGCCCPLVAALKGALLSGSGYLHPSATVAAVLGMHCFPARHEPGSPQHACHSPLLPRSPLMHACSPDTHCCPYHLCRPWLLLMP